MKLFDFLKDIIYKKQGDLLEDLDSKKEFQPYLIQRWLSMYSPDVSNAMNESTNRLWTIFGDKEDWYKSFLYLLPILKFKKIEYIKKNKKEKNEILQKKEDTIKFLAKNHELSEREIRTYIDNFDIDISTYQKVLKK